jgi:putative nucleotidyltransferase with HDIG domain
MKKTITIPPYIYFIIITAVIIILFPRENTFRYAFVEGRPWKYGLLTAPFDFPIYKSDQQLKAEQDSVLGIFKPYFRYDENVYSKQLESFRADYANYPKEYWTHEYKQYIENTLKEIYSYGIISVKDYNFLIDNCYSIFKSIQKDNKVVLYATNDVFTAKSAYSYLLDKYPNHLHSNVLRSVDLNIYLRENMRYDESLSEKVKQDDLQQISLSMGMVQAGEKIVDKGEIVNENIYNILRSYKQIQEQKTIATPRQTGLFIGISILVIVLMSFFLLYLICFRKKIYAVKKDVVFLLIISSLFVFLTEICMRSELFNIYIIPYAIIPIVVRTFFESRTAHLTHFITVLICSLMVPFSFEFIILQFVVCMVALYILKDLTQRSELIVCAIYIVASYIVGYIGILLFQDGNLSKINWYMFLFFGINFLFVMFTYSFIYIIEKIFGYISNVTLVELSDISLPVLVELSEKCPGTFQHSLQVSMLGTAAASKVGANPQLIRTGSLYHDLGKIERPLYFAENKMEGNVNPHDNLSFEQSARIITNHVTDGVKIAEKYGLPPTIIKFIQTHHGTGKAKFFYNSYKNAFPDKPIDESAFSYSGINPDTKETAILMMADSVEAASRSLKNYNEETIRNLVNKIIDGQIADGLLNNAPLTFNDITTIKNIFVEKLLTVYHSRISYPELKNG